MLSNIYDLLPEGRATIPVDFIHGGLLNLPVTPRLGLAPAPRRWSTAAAAAAEGVHWSYTAHTLPTTAYCNRQRYGRGLPPESVLCPLLGHPLHRLQYTAPYLQLPPLPLYVESIHNVSNFDHADQNMRTQQSSLLSPNGLEHLWLSREYN